MKSCVVLSHFPPLSLPVPLHSGNHSCCVPVYPSRNCHTHVYTPLHTHKGEHTMHTYYSSKRAPCQYIYLYLFLAMWYSI